MTVGIATNPVNNHTIIYYYYIIIIPYSVSHKKTRPLRLIWHYFTNSQYLLIIFGMDRSYSILNWLC